MDNCIKEKLVKQLELLHEASKKDLLPSELAELTLAMAELLRSVPDYLV